MASFPQMIRALKVPAATTLVMGLLSFGFFSGCSIVSAPQENGLIYRLKNRGPVPLSSDNPFLAANLLIAKEMEKSPEVAGFVKHRGAPAALEVEKGIFSGLVLHFFYPENREQFTFEQVDNGWFIRGPETIEKEKFTSVAQITRTLVGEPRLEYNYMSPSQEKALNDKNSNRAIEEFETRRSASETAREPDSFNRALDSYQAAEPRAGGAFQSPSSRRYQKPVSTREQLQELVSRTAEANAEVTPKGDLVHYVTYQGETLSMIARWYTGDRANVGRLARMNRLPHPDHLEIGDTLIIPSYLIQNKKRLSEQAVKELEVIAREDIKESW
jgi:hypothetical protein